MSKLIELSNEQVAILKDVAKASKSTLIALAYQLAQKLAQKMPTCGNCGRADHVVTRDRYYFCNYCYTGKLFLKNTK